MPWPFTTSKEKAARQEQQSREIILRGEGRKTGLVKIIDAQITKMGDKDGKLKEFANLPSDQRERIIRSVIESSNMPTYMLYGMQDNPKKIAAIIKAIGSLEQFQVVTGEGIDALRAEIHYARTASVEAVQEVLETKMTTAKLVDDANIRSAIIPISKFIADNYPCASWHDPVWDSICLRLQTAKPRTSQNIQLVVDEYLKSKEFVQATTNEYKIPQSQSYQTALTNLKGKETTKPEAEESVHDLLIDDHDMPPSSAQTDAPAIDITHRHANSGQDSSMIDAAEIQAAEAAEMAAEAAVEKILASRQEQAARAAAPQVPAERRVRFAETTVTIPDPENLQVEATEPPIEEDGAARPTRARPVVTDKVTSKEFKIDAAIQIILQDNPTEGAIEYLQQAWNAIDDKVITGNEALNTEQLATLITGLVTDARQARAAAAQAAESPRSASPSLMRYLFNGVRISKEAIAYFDAGGKPLEAAFVKQAFVVVKDSSNIDPKGAKLPKGYTQLTTPLTEQDLLQNSRLMERMVFKVAALRQDKSTPEMAKLGHVNVIMVGDKLCVSCKSRNGDPIKMTAAMKQALEVAVQEAIQETRTPDTKMTGCRAEVASLAAARANLQETHL